MSNNSYNSLEEIDTRLTAISDAIEALDKERGDLGKRRIDFIKNLASANRISAKDCEDFEAAVAAAVEKALQSKKKPALVAQPAKNVPKVSLKEGCYSAPGLKDYLYYENKRGPKPLHAIPENWKEFTQIQLEIVMKEKSGSD